MNIFVGKISWYFSNKIISAFTIIFKLVANALEQWTVPILVSANF